MRKLKRRKIVREFIESRIEKNQRRIQAIAEETYKLRLQLEALVALPENKPTTKENGEAPVPATPENTEAVTDNADQEIGMSAPVEETKNAL